MCSLLLYEPIRNVCTQSLESNDWRHQFWLNKHVLRVCRSSSETCFVYSSINIKIMCDINSSPEYCSYQASKNSLLGFDQIITICCFKHFSHLIIFHQKCLKTTPILFLFWSLPIHILFFAFHCPLMIDKYSQTMFVCNFQILRKLQLEADEGGPTVKIACPLFRRFRRIYKITTAMANTWFIFASDLNSKETDFQFSVFLFENFIITTLDST